MKKLVLAFFVLFAVLISLCNTVLCQSKSPKVIGSVIKEENRLPASTKVVVDLIYK